MQKQKFHEVKIPDFLNNGLFPIEFVEDSFSPSTLEQNTFQSNKTSITEQSLYNQNQQHETDEDTFSLQQNNHRKSLINMKLSRKLKNEIGLHYLQNIQSQGNIEEQLKNKKDDKFLRYFKSKKTKNYSYTIKKQIMSTKYFLPPEKQKEEFITYKSGKKDTQFNPQQLKLKIINKNSSQLYDLQKLFNKKQDDEGQKSFDSYFSGFIKDKTQDMEEENNKYEEDEDI